MKEKTVRLLSTFFYVGDMPMAPGTAASFVGLLLAVILHVNIFLYVLVTAVVIWLGLLVSGQMEKVLGKKDPGCVVIDEVAGILISLFLLPLTMPVLITAFFVFRAFDMFKIYPANKLEDMGGALGIMADDIMAGVYTCVVMHIALRLMG